MNPSSSRTPPPGLSPVPRVSAPGKRSAVAGVSWWRWLGRGVAAIAGMGWLAMLLWLGPLVLEPWWAGPAVRPWAPPSKSKVFGYVDVQGRWKVLPGLERAEEFHEGLALVQYDSRFWAYLDERGRVAIPALRRKDGQTVPGIGWVAAGPFSEGLAVVQTRGTWVVIDRAGREVFHVDDMPPIENEPLRVKVSDGLLVVPTRHGPGVVDRLGSWQMKPGGMSGPDWISKYENGVATAGRLGKQGLIDKSGRVVMPFEYDSILCLAPDRYAVSRDERCGVVDARGQVVLPMSEHSLVALAGGKRCKLFRENDGAVLDADGHVLFTTALSPLSPEIEEGLLTMHDARDKDRKTFCWLDEAGRVALKAPAGVCMIDPFRNGLAQVTAAPDKEHGLTVSLMDRQGKMVISGDLGGP